MRGLVTSLIFLAAAGFLALAMVLPITQVEAEAGEPFARSYEVSDARYSLWTMNDVVGPRSGSYWSQPPIEAPTGPGFQETSDRGDLAPWLGPTTMLSTMLMLGAAGAAPWAPKRRVVALALAACFLLLIVGNVLLHDLLGLPLRIAQEAQSAYIETHPGMVPRDIPAGGLDTAFLFWLWANTAAILGTFGASRLRPRHGPAPLPRLEPA